MLGIETGAFRVYAEDWAAYALLLSKFHQMQGSIGAVSKDSTNPHFRYSYTSYEALAPVVRRHAQLAGLVFSVGANAVESDLRNQMRQRLLSLQITFADKDTGAMLVISGYGEGEDKGDKATAKALTSGVKYMLMRTLLISSEDDVDPDAVGDPGRHLREGSGGGKASTSASGKAPAAQAEAQQKEAQPDGRAEKGKAAFAKWFYTRWGKVFPDDKDRAIAHREFAVASIKDLDAGDYKAAQRHAPILGILDWAKDKALGLDDVKKGLDIGLLHEWEGTMDEGLKKIHNSIGG